VRVLFIHNEYQQSGGEDIALHLEQQALLRSGHEVYSVIFSNKWETENDSKWMAAKNAIYNKSADQLVTEKLEEIKPDVVHVHNIFFRASPSILYACRKQNVPVVMTLHNYRLICSNALLMRNNRVCEDCVHKTVHLPGIIHKCYRNSLTESILVSSFSGFHKVAGTWKEKVNKYIALTDFARNRILDSSLHLKPEQVVVKPNYSPDFGVGKDNRESFYLFVGRLSKEKGIDFLLEAAAQAGISLVIAGEGPERERLENMYASYTKIKFSGNLERAKVIELMKKCKALIFPSIWYEGLPYTILEAFSTGTPVLASKLGAMEELIKDGYNGIHFEAANSDSIIKALIRFENGKSCCMYTNARKSYEERYTIEKHLESIVSIYQSVLNES
jgi:glycosyltransferase involved in cell wall biosynthesis